MVAGLRLMGAIGCVTVCCLPLASSFLPHTIQASPSASSHLQPPTANSIPAHVSIPPRCSLCPSVPLHRRPSLPRPHRSASVPVCVCCTYIRSWAQRGRTQGRSSPADNDRCRTGPPAANGGDLMSARARQEQHMRPKSGANRVCLPTRRTLEAIAVRCARTRSLLGRSLRRTFCSSPAYGPSSCSQQLASSFSHRCIAQSQLFPRGWVRR